MWKNVQMKDHFQNTVLSVSTPKTFHNSWERFVNDIHSHTPCHQLLSNDAIERRVTMTEMENMVDIYFNTDVDVFRNHSKEEIYSTLSDIHPEWFAVFNF